MQFNWWLAVSALYSLWPAAVANGCQHPGPGQCVTNNSKHFGDREVLTLDRLSCPFRGSLCSFRQGCQDGNMSPWAVGDGFAWARQRASEGSCAAFSYSVLESPWINFTIPVCLHFSFSRYLPQALAVFLASRTSSDAVTALLQENDNEFLDGQNQTESFTIPQLVGKVLFRMYGGGERPDGFFFKLFPITFEEGRCETPACSFDDSEDPLCGWTAVDWMRNPGKYFARVTSPGRVATLTSPLTRATGESRRDCLQFEFSLQQSGDALNVTVDTDGDSFLLWSLEASTDNDEGWRRDARVQIVTVKAYQIVLRGQRHRNSGGVKVTNIQVTTQGSSGSCQTQPPSAAVNVTLPLRSSTPGLRGSTTPDLLGSTTPDLLGSTSPDLLGSTTPDLLGSTTPGLRGSTTPDPAGSGASKSSDGAVIGGTIAAVLVVIIVVVVVIVGFFFYRRRRVRKSENRKMGAASPVVQNGANGQREKDPNQDYAKIPDSPVSPLQHAQGYSALSHLSPTSGVTPSGDDVSPYELADDGTVRQPNAVSQRDLSHVGKAQKLADHCCDTADGQYSYISDAGNSTRPGRLNARDDSYSHLGHSQKPPGRQITDAGDNYHYIEDSEISSKSGGVHDDYNHIGESLSSAQHEITGVGDDYSHVNGSKPSPRRKGNDVNDDYNHIDSSQHHFLSENNSHDGQTSRKPVPGSSLNYELARAEADDASESNDGYSFASACSPQTGDSSKVKGENQAARETASTQKMKTAPVKAPNKGDSGDYSLQRPVPEEVGDYNTLCYDEERKQLATDTKHGVTPKPYDHVHSSPDDDYSKTQIGKRNVVIDSDYDHLKP